MEEGIEKKKSSLFKIVAIIAIIALIAVASVYLVVKKNTLTNDQNVVKNLNLCIENEKYDVPYKAFDKCFDEGYIIDNIHFDDKELSLAYDLDNNCFVLLDKDYKLSYGEDILSSNKLNVFVLVSNADELLLANSKGFSTYIKASYSDGVINTNRGIDCRYNEMVQKICYVNKENAQTVIIATNGCDLSIDGILDDVIHFGEASNIEIINIAQNSFHEHGETKTLFVYKGHVDLSDVKEDTIVVVMDGDVKVSRNENVTVVVSTEENVEIDDVSTSKSNKVVDDKVIYSILTKQQVEIAKELTGLGIEELPFEIKSEDDYKLLNTIEEDISSLYFKQVQDITLDEDVKLEKSMNVDLDGNRLITSSSESEKTLKEHINTSNGEIEISKEGLEKEKEEHKHSFSSLWTSDGSAHYHLCSCGEKSDYALCTGGSASCIKKAVCLVCKKEYGSINKDAHSLTNVAKVAPTYMDYGVLEHDYCSLCKKSFIDGIEKTAKDLQIEKLNDGYTHVVSLLDVTFKDGDKYKLEADVDLGSDGLVISADNVIFDLNGKTLKASSWITISGDNVTITNGTIKTSSQIVCNYTGGLQTTNLEKLVLVPTASRCDGIVVACPGTLNFRDCTCNSNNSTYVIQSYIHGTETNGDSIVINFYSGTYTHRPENFFFCCSRGGTLNVYDGTYTSVSRVYKNGAVNVYGGTFSQNPKEAGYYMATIDTVASGYHSNNNGNGTWTVMKD